MFDDQFVYINMVCFDADSVCFFNSSTKYTRKGIS